MSRDEGDAVAEVVSDGRTVWINSAEGCCLGRFSRFGIDVHKDAVGQVEGDPCLDCAPGLPDASGWERFRRGMLEHHGVAVEDRHRPAFLNEART